MSPGGRSHNLFAGLLVGGLLAAYAALSHYISVLPEGNAWAVLIAVAPVAIVPLDLARRSLGLAGLGLAGLLCLGGLALAWPHLATNVSWIYFLQHVALNACLGLFFARTLAPGRQPLCTFFATFVHTDLSPTLVRYTRQVTVAWAAFFFCMTAASILLFSLAPLPAWSVFANLLNLPLVALMFIVEFQARRLFLPPEERLGITDAFRAYLAARKARQVAAPPRNARP